jgi:hypothetical protein
MADDQPVDLPESSAPPGSETVDTPPAVPCRHLRNKGMFVYNGGAFGVPTTTTTPSTGASRQ